MNNMRNGRTYRVSGASSVTGEEVEILVEAHDEADAARAANRQGVFVSGCAPARGHVARDCQSATRRRRTASRCAA